MPEPATNPETDPEPWISGIVLAEADMAEHQRLKQMETVADRLADSRVRVRPLVWDNFDTITYRSGPYSICRGLAGKFAPFVAFLRSHDGDDVLLYAGELDACMGRCNAHNAAAVMANLEVVPSEDV